jgi:endonuclease G, mitochondrial
MNDALPQGRIDEVVAATLATVGYDANIRQISMQGLPPAFVGLLPGSGVPPRVSLFLDLGFLNGRRLVGGIIPLKTWLNNVTKLAGPMEEAAPIREALAELEGLTTGAPTARADGPVNKKRIVSFDSSVANEKLVIRNDMLPLGFLASGLSAAKAVAKLVVPRFESGNPRVSQDGTPVSYLGTGWLIAPGLLMTNHHVINARNDGEPAASEADLRAQTAGMKILFDYDGTDAQGTNVAPVELVGWNDTLDYALVKIADAARLPLKLARVGITTVPADTAIAVNVIQHPNGESKKLGIRNNLVSNANQTDLKYFTDTLGGSSGSPVLNDRWEVVALHRGATTSNGATFQGVSVPYINIGTQLSAIMTDLLNRYPGAVPPLN